VKTPHTAADLATFNRAFDTIRDEPANAGIEPYLIADAVKAVMRPGMDTDEVIEAAVDRLHQQYSPSLPETVPMTNASRARRALRALAVNPDPDTADAIVGLLADLRHACDLLGLDYADLARLALWHYREETSSLSSEIL